MPARRFLFIPFLSTKIQKRQMKNRLRGKSHLKKPDRTNITATNFVWEQLKTTLEREKDMIRKSNKNPIENQKNKNRQKICKNTVSKALKP